MLARQALAAAPPPFAAVLALRTLLVYDLTAGWPGAALRWAEAAIAQAEDGAERMWANELRTLRAVTLAELGRTDEAAGQARAALDEAIALGSPTLQVWAALASASLLALDDRAAARAMLALSFAGRTVRLPDSKGLGDLAALLARPGREVHCTELAGAAVEQPDTGEVLDTAARRRYEARIGQPGTRPAGGAPGGGHWARWPGSPRSRDGGAGADRGDVADPGRHPPDRCGAPRPRCAPRAGGAHRHLVQLPAG